MGRPKFFPRKQFDRTARNGAASGSRVCRSRPARNHVGGKNRRAMEEWGSLARRGQRESVFGKADPLYTPTGLVDGGILDCGKHRRASIAFAGGTDATDSLYRSGAPARSGGDYDAG